MKRTYRKGICQLCGGPRNDNGRGVCKDCYTSVGSLKLKTFVSDWETLPDGTRRRFIASHEEDLG